MGQDRTGTTVPPAVGTPAPPLTLPTLDGRRVSLAEFAPGPVLVSFLRHAGCLICRAHLLKVLDRWPRIEAMGASALFVVHDEAAKVRAGMLADLDDLPFPVLVDLPRTSYRDWGLRRARWHEVWLDPRVYRTYARLLRGGERLRAGGRDVLQLGGDFVVDATSLATHSRPQVRDDRPPVTELMDALAAAAGTTHTGGPGA